MTNQVICDCDVIHPDIVNNVQKRMPENNEFSRLSDLYKMFSDPTRLKIMWALHEDEICVCDLAVILNMTKSAVSHQLKSLRIANLVKFERRGKSVYYSLADDHVKDIFEEGFEHINE